MQLNLERCWKFSLVATGSTGWDMCAQGKKRSWDLPETEDSKQIELPSTGYGTRCSQVCSQDKLPLPTRGLQQLPWFRMTRTAGQVLQLRTICMYKLECVPWGPQVVLVHNGTAVLVVAELSFGMLLLC